MTSPTASSIQNGMPTRKSETKHRTDSKPCHHFTFHRLSCADFDRLKARARGCCEICGVPEAEAGGKRLVVDHFRGGGLRIVRGLLCDKCNTVMSCIDGTKAWGSNRSREPQAREYEANSWQQPSPEQWPLIRQVQESRRSRLSLWSPGSPSVRQESQPITAAVGGDEPPVAGPSPQHALRLLQKVTLGELRIFDADGNDVSHAWISTTGSG